MTGLKKPLSSPPDSVQYHINEGFYITSEIVTSCCPSLYSHLSLQYTGRLPV